MLRAWLNTVKLSSVVSQSESRVRIYIGNEAGDLDSVTCALLAAYTADNAKLDNVRHVPVLNFAQACAQTFENILKFET